MRKVIILICILTSFGFLLCDNRVMIYDNSNNKFTGQLLFGTDSVLYIWTGLTDFEPTNIEYVKAVKYHDILKINLKTSVSWKEGMRKALPSSILTGSVASVVSVRKSELEDILIFNAVYNLTYCLIVGGFISIFSHTPKNIHNPSDYDFQQLNNELRNYFLFTDRDRKLINQIIQEVKP